MTNMKATKKALLSSVLALVLCFSMLLGTTFAWFTDSVTSEGNIIKSGTLNVGMYWADGTEAVPALDPKDSAWTDAASGAMFTADQIWEPGYVDVKHIMITNEGTLALKYALSIVANGVVSDLSDVIDVYFIDSAVQVADRTALTDTYKLGTLTDVLAGLETGTYGVGSLKAGEEVAVTLALKMQETAGNDYQDKSIGSDFSVKLLATQLASETDSFDEQYDADSTTYEPWDGTTNTTWYTGDKTEYTLTTAEQLAGLAELVNAGNDFADITVKLGTDVDLQNKAWTPIGKDGAPFAGTFDGCGYAIANLNVTGTTYVGLFGQVGDAIGGDFGSIYNVVIEGATVTGTQYAGAVVGGGYLEMNSLAGCTVSGATIICNVDDTGDNGDKAGVIAGFILNANIYGNKAVNSTIYAYRDLGGIVGCVTPENYDVKVYGNTVENVSLNYIEYEGYADGKENQNMADFVGRPNDYEGNVVIIENNKGEATKNGAATFTDSVEGIMDALEAGNNILLTDDVAVDPATSSSGYGTTGLNQKNGGVFDGNGNTLDVSGASDTWDSAINTTGGTIKNITVTGAFRGIFINHNSTHSERVILENVTSIPGAYTISCDQGTNQGLTATNCTFNGWTSYAATLGDAEFINCNFGSNGSYAYMRPFAETTLTGCVFSEGFEFDARKTTVTFVDCYVGDTLITAENITTLLGANAANAVVKNTNA